ncbi:MAG TPA: DNA-binding domain-containing protein [Methylomirabilota bacterium]|jgi:hypothetical protein|nr:DNA-binding domain-containing protein [Methylomirabilota bacterium]
MLSLRELQERFFASIARTPGAGPGSFDPALVGCVAERGPLGAAARVDIYAQMYYARLFDVLKEDFPRVAAILGDDRAHAIISAYLAQHPSTHPSLRQLGRCFPGFLQNCQEAADLPFLGDLAMLEWTRLEVFDAPDAELLRVEHLQSIAPEKWPGLTLRLIPALQVVHSEWPVHEIWKAAETEDAPALPEIHPEKTILRVWRKGFSVYHTKIDALESAALAHVGTGESFAAVCGALESLRPAEEPAVFIGRLLLRWIEDGVLARCS